MDTKNYFDLGIKFARVHASTQMPEDDQEREFLEFVSSCKVIGVVAPASFEEIINLSTYAEKFINPLVEFKRDLFRAGILSFSLFLLHTSSKYLLYKKLKIQDVKPNVSEISHAFTEMVSLFEKWELNTDFFDTYKGTSVRTLHKHLQK